MEPAHDIDDPVQVWLADLHGLAESCGRCIVASEWERAATFVYERDRERFIARREMLRHVLSPYLHVPPRHVQIEIGTSGMPRLATRSHGPDYRFSLSSAGPICAIAVAYRLEVGVDVETRRHGVRALELASRFMTPTERRALQRAGLTELAALAIWSRKEALLKALGRGLAIDMQQVSFDAVGRYRDGVGRPWYAADLEVPGDFVGALVTQGTRPRVVSRWPVGSALLDSP